ncbi:lysophospholipid acyltransferase family protein [Ornithinimicrobium avium]|uniref:1-acyl-sn-glycerol-3-phosphate acyltransferase n=1 Tax=Ornithinimicrobium avium TaxID=2283195 RepID=A0A345NJY4_9MICO|nr:1-acyl-sn-glycerol-3-phosphate acyltransferase [Ornithinimicrobium avium]
MSRNRWAASARHVLWRAASTLVGGVRIGGHVPDGPMVLVANHTSHADTAALLAAVPPDRLPVLAAAEDYWFRQPLRRAVVTGLVGALPVPRDGGGGYEALRAAAAPVLAGGGTVVIYPEGTRGRPGEDLGRFRSGALRLAADEGVPLVPVGISGTGRVLPKHGRLRPAGVVLRFGQALPPQACPGDPGRGGARGGPGAARRQQRGALARLARAPVARPAQRHPARRRGLRLGSGGGPVLAGHRRDVPRPRRRPAAPAPRPAHRRPGRRVGARGGGARRRDPRGRTSPRPVDHPADARHRPRAAAAGGCLGRAPPGVQRHTHQGLRPRRRRRGGPR